MDKMNKVFDWVDAKAGPDKIKYPKACLEAREMVMDCVIHSECFGVEYLSYRNMETSNIACRKASTNHAKHFDTTTTGASEQQCSGRRVFVIVTPDKLS